MVSKVSRGTIMTSLISISMDEFATAMDKMNYFCGHNHDLYGFYGQNDGCCGLYGFISSGKA